MLHYFGTPIMIVIVEGQCDNFFLHFYVCFKEKITSKLNFLIVGESDRKLFPSLETLETSFRSGNRSKARTL